VTVNQIQQREKENPNDIDEVPVQADHVDGRVIGGAELSAPSLVEEP
jgi:hypothetical protein